MDEEVGSWGGQDVLVGQHLVDVIDVVGGHALLLLHAEEDRGPVHSAVKGEARHQHETRRRRCHGGIEIFSLGGARVDVDRLNITIDWSSHKTTRTIPAS